MSKHDDVLDQIIRMSTFSADLAVLNGQYTTMADAVRRAVNAAIRAAVAHDVLRVADDAEARFAAGFTWSPGLGTVSFKREPTRFEGEEPIPGLADALTWLEKETRK